MKLSEELSGTNPIRLGIGLNYSVFLYEVEGNPKAGIDVAKRTFDVAIAGLENIEEEHYKDSTVIFSLLRDNLTLWMSEDEN